MEARVKILLRTVNDGVSQALYYAFRPDNRDLPRGLRIKMYIRSECLIVDLLSRGRMETLLMTIDEILEHAQISLEILDKMA